MDVICLLKYEPPDDCDVPVGYDLQVAQLRGEYARMVQAGQSLGSKADDLARRSIQTREREAQDEQVGHTSRSS